MKKVFIQTQNVKNFITSIKEAEGMPDEPVLLVFHGPAGRGKSDASTVIAAQEGWTYCRALTGWSELWMLQDLCFELRIDPIPKRKKPAFEAIIKRLRVAPNVVIIDEADKMPLALLEWVRDIVDLTAVPFALVGEKLLKHKMKREKRMWSRTLRLIEFKPISTKDILFFAKQASNLALNAQQAELISQSAEGDFRPAKRQIYFIEELVRVNSAERITDDMVKIAIKKEEKERSIDDQ